MSNKVYTVSEASKYLNTTERSITRYITSDKLKATVELNDRGQKRYLINDADLRNFKTDRDNKAKRLSESPSDSQTSQNEEKKPDSQTDNTDNTNIDSPFLKYLLKENEELKTENKELNGKLVQVAFESGQLKAEVKMLRTDNQTNETDTSDSEVSDNTDISDKKTETEVKKTETIKTDNRQTNKSVRKWILGASALCIIVVIVVLVVLVSNGTIHLSMFKK